MGKQEWDSFDVLEGVLALMGKQTFPASVPAVHNAFHALAEENGGFKPFLEGYLFQERTGFFYSEKLQTYLENMEHVGLLSCVNPDFDAYKILPKMKTTFNKHVAPTFTQAEIKTLEAMARAFKTQVNTENKVSVA